MRIADRVDWLLARATSRAALPFVVGAAVLVVAILLLGREIVHHLASIESWIADSGQWGRVAFVGLLILCTSVLVPESLFGIAAGALFGVTEGVITLAVGNLLAAAVQYALARWLLRARIEPALASRPQLAAIERAVRSDEIRLQALLRLTPLNPTTMSYVFGAAGVRFSGFMLACLALLPHLFIETYIGHAGKHLARIGGSSSHTFNLHDAVTIGGLVVSVVVVIAVSRIARTAVSRAMVDTRPRNDLSGDPGSDPSHDPGVDAGVVDPGDETPQK